MNNAKIEGKEEGFKNGATVQLKSGGAPMTVAGYEQSGEEWFVRVFWMNEGTIMRDTLPPHILEKAPEPDLSEDSEPE